MHTLEGQVRDAGSSAGRQPLVTLADAREYILKLPKAEQNSAEWQAAVEAMLHAGAGEAGRRMMFARIGIMRALSRHQERVFSDRKDPVWRRSKPRR